MEKILAAEDRMMRPKTKIVCTLGLVSKSIEMIEKLLKAGTNIAHFNFSYGFREYHQETLDNLKTTMANTVILYAVMLDTRSSCRELGDIPKLGSSLRLSCKAPRLIIGVDTPMPKLAIIRATNYEARARPKLEVGFKYLSEVSLMRNLCAYRATVEYEQRGRARIRPSSSLFNQVKVTRLLGIVMTVQVKIVIPKMSPEEMLNVGGEEEVKSLSLSSSSSGGSGSGTSISGSNGGQEDSIVPTNILEVGDGQARCYDEREEVVGEVIGYKSCWRSREELGHLVENYNIPPHVLVRPAESEERAYLTPKDHWMLLYVHYLAVGLRFPTLELLVALLKEFGLGLMQLVLNGVWLVVGFLVYYQLRGGEGGGGEVGEGWGGAGKHNVPYCPEVVESSRIYGRSSLNGEKMNRLRARGKAIQLPEMRLKASASGTIKERVGGGTSRPYPNGGARAEVGPSSEPRRGSTEERVAAQKRQRVEEVKPLQIEAPIEFVSSFYESGRTAAKCFIISHFPEVDLQRAKDEVATNGGSGVVQQAVEIANLVNAMVDEFFDFLQEQLALVRKNEELNHQKKVAEKNFNELTSELEKVKEELASSKRAAELEEQKRKKCEEALAKKDNELAEVKRMAELAIHNSVEQHVLNFIKSPTFSEVVNLYHLPTLVMAFTDCRKKVKIQNLEVDMTNNTFGLEEARIEENGDSKTAKFHPEFITIDEEEAEVPQGIEVADNVRDEEVDQQHQIIDKARPAHSLLSN
ncbi:hypothetical protein SLEP1_g17553 [Rubroshorea leprosula]|uniref:pyruvate kinase n=1 Tax=Rubroshorea leprosula TaxID=152421 RepID=A0AAV5IUQ8_9ROSI|nr:hypothetical protein SLEP1_g17553 [Rubroshorea leprosula]